MNENAIELQGLGKSFGRTKAVADLSMHVPAGRVVGFLGPNGAGKTTTIKMLMHLVRPDAGGISVLGLDPTTATVEVRRRVGYVPEQHFVPRWMRVEEAIRLGRTLFPTWDDRLCEELLRLFALEEKKPFRALSKGMQVKLAILLALAHRPELLVLDEPMAGLDPLIREELLDGVLQTAGDRPRTVLFSSHTFADVQRLADEVAILHEGRLLVQCPCDQLLQTTKRVRVVLGDGGEPSAPPPQTVWQQRDRREWLLTVRDFSSEKLEWIRSHNAVANVEVLDLSLEEIFKDFIHGQRGKVCT